MLQVRLNTKYYLHYPRTVANPIEPRGGPGYVVDDTHPLEVVLNEEGEVVGGWLHGQMHKMEPAPEGAVAAPYELAQARTLMKEFAKGQKNDPPGTPPPTAATVLAEKLKRVGSETMPTGVAAEPLPSGSGSTIPVPEVPATAD